MVSYRLVAAAGLFASVYALPLNINLGAYSPALVVGDGEISFGGGQDVSKLFNTLEGAAQSGGAAGAATAGAATGTTGGAASGAAASPKTASVSEAAAAPQSTPATEVAAAAAEPEVAASSTEDSSTVAAAPDAQLQEQAAISTLQGMGKEIAPRDEAPQKRDLASFDRALKFAEAALTKGPIVQLGTGEKGAGVGIIVDNRPGAAAGGAAGGAAKGKREEGSATPRRHTKVTTMYVRRGVPAEMQTTEFERRGLKTVPVVAKREDVASSSSEAKRDTSSVLDSINLNVDDPQGVTMTFVEETSEDDA